MKKMMGKWKCSLLSKTDSKRNRNRSNWEEPGKSGQRAGKSGKSGEKSQVKSVR